MPSRVRRSRRTRNEPPEVVPPKSDNDEDDDDGNSEEEASSKVEESDDDTGSSGGESEKTPLSRRSKRSRTTRTTTKAATKRVSRRRRGRSSADGGSSAGSGDEDKTTTKDDTTSHHDDSDGSSQDDEASSKKPQSHNASSDNNDDLGSSDDDLPLSMIKKKREERAAKVGSDTKRVRSRRKKGAASARGTSGEDTEEDSAARKKPTRRRGRTIRGRANKQEVDDESNGEESRAASALDTNEEPARKRKRGEGSNDAKHSHTEDESDDNDDAKGLVDQTPVRRNTTKGAGTRPSRRTRGTRRRRGSGDKDPEEPSIGTRSRSNSAETRDSLNGEEYGSADEKSEEDSSQASRKPIHKRRLPDEKPTTDELTAQQEDKPEGSDSVKEGEKRKPGDGSDEISQPSKRSRSENVDVAMGVDEETTESAVVDDENLSGENGAIHQETPSGDNGMKGVIMDASVDEQVVSTGDDIHKQNASESSSEDSHSRLDTAGPEIQTPSSEPVDAANAMSVESNSNSEAMVLEATEPSSGFGSTGPSVPAKADLSVPCTDKQDKPVSGDALTEEKVAEVTPPSQEGRNEENDVMAPTHAEAVSDVEPSAKLVLKETPGEEKPLEVENVDSAPPKEVVQPPSDLTKESEISAPPHNDTEESEVSARDNTLPDGNSATEQRADALVQGDGKSSMSTEKGCEDVTGEPVNQPNAEGAVVVVSDAEERRSTDVVGNQASVSLPRTENTAATVSIGVAGLAPNDSTVGHEPASVGDDGNAAPSTLPENDGPPVVKPSASVLHEPLSHNRDHEVVAEEKTANLSEARISVPTIAPISSQTGAVDTDVMKSTVEGGSLSVANRPSLAQLPAGALVVTKEMVPDSSAKQTSVEESDHPVGGSFGRVPPVSSSVSDTAQVLGATSIPRRSGGADALVEEKRTVVPIRDSKQKTEVGESDPIKTRKKRIPRVFSSDFGAIPGFLRKSALFVRSGPQKQMVAQVSIENGKIGRIKALLFSEGFRSHRGKGFERVFAEYWDAVSLRLSDRLSSHTAEKCNHAINTFLKNSRLRRLHNKLIMSVMKQSFASRVAFGDISGYIPKAWLNRVEGIRRGKEFKDDSEGFDHVFASPGTDNSGGSAVDVYRSAWPDAPLEEQKKLSAPDSNSSFVPGALVADPLVHGLADECGLKVSENAVWLMAVAVKEQTKRLLQASVTQSRNVERGEAPLALLRYPKVLTSLKSPKKDTRDFDKPLETAESHQPVERKRSLSCMDIYAGASSIPAGPIGSLGGGSSRSALEKCQQSVYSVCSHTHSGCNFQSVQSFLAEQIVTEANRRKKLPPPKRPAPRPRPSPPRKPDPQKTEHVVAQSTEVPVPQSTNSGTAAAQASGVRGMGRGAKNLAAMMNRAKSSGSEGGSSSGVPTPASVAPRQAPAQTPGVSPPADVGGRRGKGFGMKNLAAMRARASETGDNSEQEQAAPAQQSDVQAASSVQPQQPSESSQVPPQQLHELERNKEQLQPQNADQLPREEEKPPSQPEQSSDPQGQHLQAPSANEQQPQAAVDNEKHLPRGGQELQPAQEPKKVEQSQNPERSGQQSQEQLHARDQEATDQTTATPREDREPPKASEAENLAGDGKSLPSDSTPNLPACNASEEAASQIPTSDVTTPAPASSSNAPLAEGEEKATALTETEKPAAGSEKAARHSETVTPGLLPEQKSPTGDTAPATELESLDSKAAASGATTSETPVAEHPETATSAVEKDAKLPESATAVEQKGTEPPEAATAADEKDDEDTEPPEAATATDQKDAEPPQTATAVDKKEDEPGDLEKVSVGNEESLAKS